MAIVLALAVLAPLGAGTAQEMTALEGDVAPVHAPVVIKEKGGELLTSWPPAKNCRESAHCLSKRCLVPRSINLGVDFAFGLQPVVEVSPILPAARLVELVRPFRDSIHPRERGLIVRARMRVAIGVGHGFVSHGAGARRGDTAARY
jgi:hypothetical protein